MPSGYRHWNLPLDIWGRWAGGIELNSILVIEGVAAVCMEDLRLEVIWIGGLDITEETLA